jgi:acetyl/propionyl-CoA carboxylase alpha subunit
VAVVTGEGKLRATVDGPEPLVVDVSPASGRGPVRGTFVTPIRLPGISNGEGVRFEVVVDGWRFEVGLEPTERAELRERAARIGGGRSTTARQVIRAQIPGRVVSVAVAAGELVERGQRLLSIEAMKMENAVLAPRAGTIERVGVAAGQDVELGNELLVMA